MRHKHLNEFWERSNNPSECLIMRQCTNVGEDNGMCKEDVA